jgi:hypothetical protein
MSLPLFLEMRSKLVTRQLRLTPEAIKRARDVSRASNLPESEVLRAAIDAGLGQLERGEYNPFQRKKA